MKKILISMGLLAMLTACEDSNQWLTGLDGESSKDGSLVAPVDSAPLSVEWDDLIPKGFTAEALMAKYKIESYEPDDPRRTLVIQAMEAEWASAPMNEKLDDKKVTLAGFIVPLEIEAAQVREFLLVPFLGACIHVPPPPPNQLVYVKMQSPIDMPNDYEAFSVTGIIKAESIDSELAEAGYQMKGLSLVKFSDETLNDENELMGHRYK